MIGLTHYARRDMALDAHLASDDDARMRKVIVLAEAKYFEQTLVREATPRKAPV